MVLWKPWRKSVTTNIWWCLKNDDVWILNTPLQEEWKYQDTSIFTFRHDIWQGYHFKSSFIILLKVLRLNQSSLHLQLIFLAFFSTYNLITPIVSSVLTVLLLPHLPLMMFSLKIVRIRSYSGPHFPAFGLNTERYVVSLRIQSWCRKSGPE